MALSVADAQRAYDIAHFGSADYNDERAAWADLKAARLVVETSADKAKRLTLEAQDRDGREAYHMAEEASLSGRIASCRSFGNHEQAAVLEIQRTASLRCAQRAAAEAETIRTEIASINRRIRYADDVVAALHAAE